MLSVCGRSLQTPTPTQKGSRQSTGITRYWADRSAHPERVDAFTSLEGAKQRHAADSPNPERHSPDS